MLKPTYRFLLIKVPFCVSLALAVTGMGLGLPLMTAKAEEKKIRDVGEEPQPQDTDEATDGDSGIQINLDDQTKNNSQTSMSKTGICQNLADIIKSQDLKTRPDSFHNINRWPDALFFNKSVQKVSPKRSTSKKDFIKSYPAIEQVISDFAYDEFRHYYLKGEQDIIAPFHISEDDKCQSILIARKKDDAWHKLAKLKRDGDAPEMCSSERVSLISIDARPYAVRAINTMTKTQFSFYDLSKNEAQQEKELVSECTVSANFKPGLVLKINDFEDKKCNLPICELVRDKASDFAAFAQLYRPMPFALHAVSHDDFPKWADKVLGLKKDEEAQYWKMQTWSDTMLLTLRVKGDAFDATHQVDLAVTSDIDNDKYNYKKRVKLSNDLILKEHKLEIFTSKVALVAYKGILYLMRFGEGTNESGDIFEGHVFDIHGFSGKSFDRIATGSFIQGTYGPPALIVMESVAGNDADAEKAESGASENNGSDKTE